MKPILLLALASLTVSCGFTGQGQAVRQGVATYGAQAMDEGLVNAEWFMCNGVSVGAAKRRYGKSVETATAYNTICGLSTEAEIIITTP